jgi:hypothetical protein
MKINAALVQRRSQNTIIMRKLLPFLLEAELVMQDELVFAAGGDD